MQTTYSPSPAEVDAMLADIRHEAPELPTLAVLAQRPDVWATVDPIDVNWLASIIVYEAGGDEAQALELLAGSTTDARLDDSRRWVRDHYAQMVDRHGMRDLLASGFSLARWADELLDNPGLVGPVVASLPVDVVALHEGDRAGEALPWTAMIEHLDTFRDAVTGATCSGPAVVLTITSPSLAGDIDLPAPLTLAPATLRVLLDTIA